MKFLLLAALACVAVKLLAGRWPWELFGPNAHEAGEKRARNLLGLHGDAGYDDIIEAHRRLIMKVHPDRGGTADAVHEANAARDLLLARIAPRARDGQR
ncbi:molecular chaperone DnaJ [Novosphingobium sp. PASSN1]|uniref:molecular chaperone DnaJ n=1 Tax=Novosphingobium sp. PASSN1 TaxID=2015561 RepID=UPI000BD7B93F|nr:molecular chaperone DnaJ [Novosphingobium sp. PASSN1]OYU36653.1 MAG: molecular chaperone DnaJ [Novosphingobium sp. PASSN1]